ncbi:MAG: flagellar hook-associated protein FlgK [Thermodesulfobacteriota bacterium]
MAGISHVLSIAKEALLAHQLSVQVASHNVANVDTEGYTRQSLELVPNQATPIAAGTLGGGVHGDYIARAYDRFMTERINNQQSLLGNLEAQEQSLRVVETIFNEAQGLALNDLLNQFWSSWQDLSNNPEILATRQGVVQAGQLLADQLHTMTAEIIRTRQDIGINLDTAMEDVNSLTQQIAALNVQISTAEGPKASANDLRDRRDELVKELSGLLDITYFENSVGQYTVLMADGHSLVETDEYWRVDWSNNQLYWVNQDIEGNETSRAVGSGAELGGKIGGWLEIRGELAENDPSNFMGRLDALANSLIRELNQQHTQGVGLQYFDSTLLGAETAKNTAVITGVVDASTASETIAAGTITINDRTVGQISGGTAVNGLAMTKAANAATAINNALTGVDAKLTTLVAGSAVNAAAIQAGDTISFTVNGATIDYTVVAGDVGNNATFAANLAAEVNSDLATYNATTANLPPEVTVKAEVGDATNGGVLNSLVFSNENAGDESDITIDNLTGTFAGAATTSDLGLDGLAGTAYGADASHNTGEITLFATTPLSVSAGNDDTYLAQLGLDSVAGDTTTNDGKFTYNPSASDPVLIQGYQYANELVGDGGSFDIWLYNSDGSLALPQAVTVSTARLYSLQDAVDAINNAVVNAAGPGNTWLTATINQNRIQLNPDSSHAFAFANDTSNFLQISGLNTFFTGHSAGSIAINDTIVNNLNHIAAGTVGTNGEILSGDNTNVLTITTVASRDDIAFRGGADNSLNGFYNALVGDIGNLGRTISRSVEFNTLVANQMSEMRDSVSGVSLDEEMANLIKYQQAFTAASRLINMSDEMLQTLLDSVR